MKKKLLAGLAAGMMVLGITGVASASIISGSFDARIDSIDGLATAFMSDFLQLGQSVTGTYTFDTDLLESHYVSAGEVRMTINGIIYSGFTINSWAEVNYSSSGDLIFIMPDFEFGACDFYAIDDLIFPDYNWNFHNESSPILLLSKKNGRFFGYWSADADLGIDEVNEGCSGSFNIGFSEPVPEPATMLLMGTGLVGLIGARRKKKA